VKQNIRSFQIHWEIELVIVTSVDLFLDPSIVPMAIGQVMVPPNAANDIYKHFHIDKQEGITMKGEDSVNVMVEFLETLVERKLTGEEASDFETNITSFWSKEGDDQGNIRFVWCCSYDGILLMAGVTSNGKVHSFVTVTGFGSFPDFLPVSKMYVRKMTYFCDSF
tara:strand:- start:244 stop:741 length:498 start_codon:yes stop_codon:yes gene_type:complete